MFGRRGKSWRSCGASLAGLALGLQLVLSSLSLVLFAVTTGPADAFGPHALCLAGETGAPQPAHPADGAPSGPVHAHDAFCCLWHHLPGVQPVALLPTQPVAYALATASESSEAAVVPAPRRGPNNARAPPRLA
jgi:hypothetical protein